MQSLILQARQDIVLRTKNKYVYCRTCDLASQKSIIQFVEKFNSGKLLVVIAKTVMSCFLTSQWVAVMKCFISEDRSFNTVTGQGQRFFCSPPYLDWLWGPQDLIYKGY
jgi:hypothetical protein